MKEKGRKVTQNCIIDQSHDLDKLFVSQSDACPQS